MGYEKYFLDTYEECRKKFKESAEDVASFYKNLEFPTIKVPSKSDDDLTIDLFYIPAQEVKKRLIILCSGVHGIEGFTGNAVQNFFIEKVIPSNIDMNSTGILMIHGINPYGFKNKRRVTENNVDMNRNFDINESLFDNTNDAYSNINDLLNPEKKILSKFFYNMFFPAKAVSAIVKYGGISTLRQAVLQGQYQYNKGIFFGGKKFEPQNMELKELLKKYMEDYKNILLIDIHTGYGKRGELHLFNASNFTGKSQAGIENVFKGYNIDGNDDKKFYLILGAFNEFVCKLANDDQLCIPMTFEFGTMDSHTLNGSINSLRNMIMENQLFYYGCEIENDEARIKNMYNEMFYPSDIQWRKQIIKQCADIFPVIIKRFNNI